MRCRRNRIDVIAAPTVTILRWGLLPPGVLISAMRTLGGLRNRLLCLRAGNRAEQMRHTSQHPPANHQDSCEGLHGKLPQNTLLLIIPHTLTKATLDFKKVCLRACPEGQPRLQGGLDLVAADFSSPALGRQLRPTISQTSRPLGMCRPSSRARRPRACPDRSHMRATLQLRRSLPSRHR